MQRLTERIISYSDVIEIKKVGNRRCKAICDEVDCKVCPVNDAFKKLAEYEDLEEQGLLLKLPCKVGDRLYIANPLYFQPDERVLTGVCKIHLFQDFMGWCIGVELENEVVNSLRVYEFADVGKTVFFTREEVEARLKEFGV